MRPLIATDNGIANTRLTMGVSLLALLAVGAVTAVNAMPRANDGTDAMIEAPSAQAALASPGSVASPFSQAIPATLRIRGRVDNDLHASLASAGAPNDVAKRFVALMAMQPALRGDLGPDDHFDLVVDTASGVNRLVYAAIDRVGARDVQLIEAAPTGRQQWLDAAAPQSSSGATVAPVHGAVTSGFGYRYHPILHFTRLHRGIDFAAHWGEPIVAAADGRVTGAGWAGGYGNQVRIAHGGALASSYSHLSRLAVAPGTQVHAGEVIGYAGSTGLSTGPHLHYEVTLKGRAINPLAAHLGGRSVDPVLTRRIKSELAYFLTVPIAPRPTT